MINQVTEIISHKEISNPYPTEIRYEKNQITFRFHTFGEIRMGFDVCLVEVFKNGKKIENLFKNSIVKISNNYEPFSLFGLYGFIPTCSLTKKISPIILNINDLNKIHLDEINGIVLGNCFSKTNENELIVTTTDKIYLVDISANNTKLLDYEFESPDFPTVFWSNKADTIIIIENKSKQAIQNIIAYNIVNGTKEIIKLKTPSEIFDFEIQTFMELTKNEDYCLFGKCSSTVGYQLNKWNSVKVSNESDSLITSSLVPVSKIYYNDNWGKKGCDVETKYAKIKITVE